MKVITLEANQKPCPYCGAKPACPDFTCPRIAVVWSCGDEWEIEFREDWQRPEPDESA